MPFFVEEVRKVFSQPGRELIDTFEYTEIQVANAATLALLAKKFRPDLIYIDAHPAGYASLLKRLREVGLNQVVIFGHSGLGDAIHQGLFDPSQFSNLYVTRRTTYDPEFANRFQAKYGEAPTLNADLGYYSVYLLAKALESSNPVAALKSGLTVKEKRFTFDEHNVHTAAPQEIWKFGASGFERTP